MPASSVYPVFSESEWNFGFLSFGKIACLTTWANSLNRAHVISYTTTLMEMTPMDVGVGFFLVSVYPTALKKPMGFET